MEILNGQRIEEMARGAAHENLTGEVERAIFLFESAVTH
jgi:hypothetical protein